MENLINITYNSYIVSTEAGFRKLLKNYNSYGKECRFEYVVDSQLPMNEKTHYYPCTSVHQIPIPVQYPVQYPCIITIQDDRAERHRITLHIRYISKETRQCLINDMKKDTTIFN